MLWLSLYLPDLPLDLLGRGTSEPEHPLLIQDGPSQRPVVYACNGAACQAGIMPGMGLGAAHSLSPELRVHVRDPQAETEALEGVAAWAGQFTSRVVLQPPAGLLLEIEGSLTLFGGLAALRARILQGLRELGYTVAPAIAPTPLGSWLLARAGQPQEILEISHLHSVLRKLPITTLERSAHLIQALRGMGVQTVNDCLHLPRDGLARRLGPELVQYLDRALGRIPDPRPAYRAPPRFQRRLVLPAEVDSTEALGFAARRLLLELSGFLRGRGCGIQNLTLDLGHRQRPPSRLTLGLVRPSRDTEHLTRLLRERLEHHALAAPVDELVLRADRLIPLEEDSRNLFRHPESTAQDWPQLVERLQARLGVKAVRGLCPLPDHRPERAWRFCTPGETGTTVTHPRRPVWLLETPKPLPVSEGAPWLDGRLRFESGPERIESGWWDDMDVARDYFIAENPRHERFWVYRERRAPERWFLHGVFG